MADTYQQRKPLEEQEVVIHVPRGAGRHVKVEESETAQLPGEIVVRVSKKRPSATGPVVGIIVK